MSLLHTNSRQLSASDIRDYESLLTRRQSDILLLNGANQSHAAIALAFQISLKLVAKEINRAVRSIFRGKEIFPFPEKLRRYPVLAPIEILHLPHRVQNILCKKNGITYVRELFTPQIISNQLETLTEIGSNRLTEIYKGLAMVNLPLPQSETGQLLSTFLYKENNCTEREILLLKTVQWGNFTNEEMVKPAKLVGAGQIPYILQKALRTLKRSSS
jgi:DNA-binding CsgD family transcriptional regulator